MSIPYLHPPVLAHASNFCLHRLPVQWLPRDFLFTSFFLHVSWHSAVKNFPPSLFIYVSSYSYFSQWINGLYNLLFLFIFMIKLTLILPLEAPSVWPLCPFDMSPNHSSRNSLLYGLQDVPGSSCTFPAPALESAISQGTLITFSGEWFSEIKISGLGMQIDIIDFSLVEQLYSHMGKKDKLQLLPHFIYNH